MVPFSFSCGTETKRPWALPLNEDLWGPIKQSRRPVAIRTNTELYWCALTKPTKTGNRMIKLHDYRYSVRPIQMIQIPFGAACDKFDNFTLFEFFHINVLG